MSVFVYGDKDFLALATQNYCQLFKYLNAIENVNQPLVLLPTSDNPIIDDQTISRGFYLPHESGLHSIEAIILRYSLGQSNMPVKPISFKDMSRERGSINFVVTQQANDLELESILYSLKPTHYSHTINHVFIISGNGMTYNPSNIPCKEKVIETSVPDAILPIIMAGTFKQILQASKHGSATSFQLPF